MTVHPISRNETDLGRIAEAILQLQQGRSIAHGEVTLAVSPATSTTVTALTCAAGSHVSLTPKTANAAALLGGGTVYVVPANGEFVIHHAADADADNTFTWAFQG